MIKITYCPTIVLCDNEECKHCGTDITPRMRSNVSICLLDGIHLFRVKGLDKTLVCKEFERKRG